MLILNFSHPLTKSQLTQIAALTGRAVDQVVHLPTQFDQHEPFSKQVQALVDALPLSSESLQSVPILVNPPAYNFAALTLLAELHGRMGYFPAILRIRPLEESTPPSYEIAEIINLQAVRDQARSRR